MNYKNFDDWFFETENYCMRCERFYEAVGDTVNSAIKNRATSAKSMETWLRAAFEAGKNETT